MTDFGTSPSRFDGGDILDSDQWSAPILKMRPSKTTTDFIAFRDTQGRDPA